MIRFFFRCLSRLSLLAIPLSLCAAPTDLTPEQVVDRLQRTYESVETLTADFQQLFSSRGIDKEEKGRLMMKKPGLMRWEYTEPDEKLFVADGKATYFYVPRDRQVMISEFDPEGAETPLLFLLGKGHLERDFVASFEKKAPPRVPGHLMVRLDPVTPQPEYTYLLLEIDPSTFLIFRLTVIEPIGNRNDYLLFNVKTNVRIADRHFQFRIPSGVEVIR